MMLTGSNIRYLFLCCLFSSLLLLEGCASSVAKKVDPSELSPIEAGKSNRNDVLKILGLPNKREVKILEENKEIEFWVYYKEGGRRSISVPFIPTGQSIDLPGAEYIMGYSAEFQVGENAEIAAIIAFDKQGVVVDMKTERNEQRNLENLPVQVYISAVALFWLCSYPAVHQKQ